MLRKLFGKSAAPSPALKAEALNPALVKTIFAVVGAHGVSPMPAAAQQAFQISTNPQADSRDFVALLESDEGLAARVLKIANSVFFDRGTSSRSLEQAVQVIGTEELRSLLSASSLGAIFPSRHPLRSALWEHDLACASIARFLAPKIAAEKKDSAYLAGLMHDVGKLLLLQRAPEQFLQAVATLEEQHLSSCEAELTVFPFTHAEIGQLVAERWNFSNDLRLAIRYHHLAWDDPLLAGPDAALVRIVKFADLVAHALGFGHSAGQAFLARQAKDDLERARSLCALDAQSSEELLQQCAQCYAHDLELSSSFGG
jgi:HD-like signal output (HDOD) protein